MPASEQTEEMIGLGDLVEFIRRWRRTIGGTVVLLTGAVAVWTLLQPQRFEAKSTLMLRKVQSSAAALAGFGALDSAPPAAREIALLGSRSLAEQVISPPPEWTNGEQLAAPPQVTGVQASLGLTTEVWSEDRVTYARLLHGAPPEHRLYARYEPGPGSPSELVVSFPEAGVISVGTPGFTGVGDEVRQDLAAGEPLPFEGGLLWLSPVGAYVGQTYRVRQISPNSAVGGLMGSTRVREIGRNSGVIEVTVADSDPYRAADAANALVHNYLGWTVGIEGRAATQTMAFLDLELERMDVLLEQAEHDLVEVAGEHTRGLNITESAAAIIERLSRLESDRTRLELARIAIVETVGRVRDGDIKALSRLPADLPDALTLSYVQAIGELLTTATQLERSDAGVYKSLLQTRLTELESWGERSELQAVRLRRLVQSLDGDQDRGVAIYASATTEDTSADFLGVHHLKQLTELDTEIASLRQVVTEEHPDLVTLRATREELLEQARAEFTSQLSGLELTLADHRELVDTWKQRVKNWPTEERSRLDASLEDLSARIVGHLESRMAGIDDQLEGLDQSVARAEGELAALPAAEQALADATRRRETYAGIVRVLLEARQQAQLQEAAALPAAVIVDPAVPVLAPAGPGLLPNLIMGAVLALMLGTGLAWLQHALRGFIATAAELEDATGMSSLGTLPDLSRGRWVKRLPGTGYAPVLDRPESPEAEVFRALRDSLEFAADPSRPLKSLAVCSSVPGEGKTTTNVNLALAFAADGKRVLLVDTDLRRGQLPGYFPECTGQIGLRDVLSGAPWASAVQYTRQPGLEVMLTGTRSRRSSVDALRGTVMRGLVAELETEYDLVVFDVPPVLALADVAGFLSGLNGVVLLTRAHHVPRQALTSTVSAMRRARVNILGTVLNGTGTIDRMYAYGYHEETTKSPELQEARWSG
jgi:capsular exopolysaccharide synthesis family protein